MEILRDEINYYFFKYFLKFREEIVFFRRQKRSDLIKDICLIKTKCESYRCMSNIDESFDESFLEKSGDSRRADENNERKSETDK